MSAEADTSRLGELLANHARFPALFTGLDRPTALYDRTGELVAVNPAGLAIVGLSFEELAGRRWEAAIEPGTSLQLRAGFLRAARGKVTRLIAEFRNVAGDEVILETSLTPAVVDGEIVGVYACAADVTALRRAERSALAELERVRELYLVAAASATSASERIASALRSGARRLGCDGGYLTRIDGDTLTFEHCTGEASRLLGQSRPFEGSVDRVVANAGHSIAGDVEPAEILETEATASAFIGTPIVVRDTVVGTVTFTNRTPRGPFGALDFEFIGLIGTLVASILERDEAERSLDALAFSDALTGLPNRLMLRDRLAETIASAALHGSSFALHFYDLDGFKRINDLHGHQRGDEVLCAIARRLNDLARGEGIVARVGGDEFVVVQPAASDRDGAGSLARRLCEAVSEPVVVDGHEHRLSASAGIAFYPQHGADATTLLGRADAALYRVKALGRNAIAFADDDARLDVAG